MFWCKQRLYSYKGSIPERLNERGSRMQRDVQAGLTGAVAGALATIPMSVVMLVSQRRGWMGDQPPMLLSSVMLGAIGKRDAGTGTKRAVATELHFDIGMMNGLLFGLLSCRAKLPVPRAVQGAIFGVLVWAVAYRGWIPWLKVMPPPEKDRPDRQITLIVAHLVYGATLGWLVNRRGC